MYVEGAVVGGVSARLAGVALRTLARDGYFDRVPPGVRAELLDTIAAIERAGRAAVLPSGGSDQAPVAEMGSSWVTAERAGDLLGVSPRRVRQLGCLLGGVKVGGRWQFDRDAVVAEAQRRRGR